MPNDSGIVPDSWFPGSDNLSKLVNVDNSFGNVLFKYLKSLYSQNENKTQRHGNTHADKAEYLDDAVMHGFVDLINNIDCAYELTQ